MVGCSCPGCDQPGTHQCSACKTKNYCGSKCQTADWPNHKEECPEHLKKMGMTNLAKARGFLRERNFLQTIRHTDIAATKLNQLKDRPIELIDKALGIKHHALLFMGRHQEALECAKEWYLLYPTNHTHPPAIEASFAVIESCVHCKEYFDAALYARTLWETITLCRDSHIPDNKRDSITARSALELARALWQLAEHGDMPVGEKKDTGKEAIMLARKAVEIFTNLRGAEGIETANSMSTLADILEFFNDVDDDEVPRLYEQAKAIYVRVHGTLSVNVASCDNNLGMMYNNRVVRASAVRDDEKGVAYMDRGVANMELALHHFREAVRIFRAINFGEQADNIVRNVVKIEGFLQLVTAERASTTRS